MSSTDKGAGASQLKLDELASGKGDAGRSGSLDQASSEALRTLYDIPVSITAVLGRTHIEVNSLLELGKGDVVELDRKVGEAIDIYVNNRLVARGEVVLIDDRLGITMTEIIKGGHTG